MNALERRLLNEFQREFPLVRRPFAVLARVVGASESWVLATLRRFADGGGVSRVGAVFRPGSVGASTLAAMAVPETRLSAVARRVSAHPEVNHNYEREHALNLWFVVAAEDEEKLGETLTAIEAETELPLIALPLVADYHIDLGFDLDGAAKRRADHASSGNSAVRLALVGRDRALVAQLQHGLPLVERPFAALAEAADWSASDGERQVIARIGEWLDSGVIKRFGVVLRHRVLGYRANAMCVWDLPAPDVDRLGRALAAEEGVTLCYRRARAGTRWPYNLYCMLHGRSRVAVESRIALLNARHGLAAYPHAVLFSRRAFKQRGARYVEAEEISRG
ncbi:MAG TPA: Lrp/AsnC family transcriptional regulator [Casimicrobiaceae bacterium]